MRAYITNPSTMAIPGTLQASFDIATGRLPSTASGADWRVRKWDGSVVDVAWYFPLAPHPDDSVRTAVATWVDTLPAGARRQMVEMVGGANTPPTFTLTAAAQRFVDNAELWITYNDLDPVWAADGSRTWTSRSNTPVNVDVLGAAREGQAVSRPGSSWTHTQYGLVRVYHGVTPIGPGAHNDWMGNTIQGLLYVHTWIRVAAGQEDAQLQFMLANTSQFPTPGSRPASANTSATTRVPFVHRSLCRSLDGLRVRLACTGVDNLQMRPWGVWNFGTGEGPAGIRSIDGVGFGQGKEWDLNIRGLSATSRYPFFFGVAWGNNGGGIRAQEAARHPAMRCGWSGNDVHTTPLRIGNFAGEFSEFGIEAGGWELPPPAIDQSILDEWHNGALARMNRFLQQQETMTDFGASFIDRNGVRQWNGHCPLYNSSVEQRNDPWNLFGYPSNPGQGGGDMKQLYYLKGGRTLYGLSPEDLMVEAFKAARFHAIQLGVRELREDERTQVRNPGTISHTAPQYSWGERNSLYTPESRGPAAVSGVQHSQRADINNQARPPVYPEGSTNPAQWHNPDEREGFPNFWGDPQRWHVNAGEHWGISRVTECTRMAPTLFPMLEHIVEKHGENAYFALPDGYYNGRTMKSNDSGSSPRLKKRFWRTMELARLFTGRAEFRDRFLEQVWRMLNDGSGNTWIPPFQNSNSRGEIANMLLCGFASSDPPPLYNMTQHVEFAWQTGLIVTFFANMAYECGLDTGETDAYPAVTNLRGIAAEHIARCFRDASYRLIRDSFGIPAARLGLTVRLLDECADWNLPMWGFGLLWHRYQGYGEEVLEGEGGSPLNLNRCLGGRTGDSYGPDRGGTGEEADIYPALIASRVWDADPLFTADIRARREYIIGRLETLSSALRTGRDYEAKGMATGGAGGGGIGWARTTVQTASIGVIVSPAAGNSPLQCIVSISGFAPGDPASYSLRVFYDWVDGQTNASNVIRPIATNSFNIGLTNTFVAETSAQRIYSVRVELLGPAGIAAEARARVEVNAVAPTAGFTILGESGYAPLSIGFRSTATGTITSIRYEVLNVTTGTLRHYATANPEVDLDEVGVYSVSQFVTGPGGSRDAVRENAFEVFDSVAPMANATITPTSGSTPLEVTLTNLSNLPGTVYFGTGDPVPSVPNQVHEFTYEDSNEFTVIVSAENGRGEIHRWTTKVYSGVVPAVDPGAVVEGAPIAFYLHMPNGMLTIGAGGASTATENSGTLDALALRIGMPDGTLSIGAVGDLDELGLDVVITDGTYGGGSNGVEIDGEEMPVEVEMPDGALTIGNAGEIQPLAFQLEMPRGEIKIGANVITQDGEEIMLEVEMPDGALTTNRGVHVTSAPIVFEFGGDGRAHTANEGGTIVYVQSEESIGFELALPPLSVFGGQTGLQRVRSLDCSLVRVRSFDVKVGV